MKAYRDPTIPTHVTILVVTSLLRIPEKLKFPSRSEDDTTNLQIETWVVRSNGSKSVLSRVFGYFGFKKQEPKPNMEAMMFDPNCHLSPKAISVLVAG